jgi:small neutral amino acid transporter SnatA (MarC family)
MNDILQASLFLLVLLNPFLVIVYLIDAMEKLSYNQFRNVLLRAGLISTIVFAAFSVLGFTIFDRIIQAEFASFQIFGGIIFLLIGIQFVFQGRSAIVGLRGESKYIAGSIAMPVLIGPGTISYSVIIGKQLDSISSVIAIFIAVFLSLFVMILLKKLFDRIQKRNEELVQRYIEISGRITAMIAGTIAIEMVMDGIRFWVDKI